MNPEFHGCESWTIKKAEHWGIDASELWYCRRLLRVPWIARRSNQSILKEISPEYSLEGLMLKLKLQYFGHLIWRLTHWKRPWCWERLRAGREGVDREWDGWMASPTQWTWVWASSGSWWWTGRPGVLQSMGWQRVGHYWATELTETSITCLRVFRFPPRPLAIPGKLCQTIHPSPLTKFSQNRHAYIWCLKQIGPPVSH